MQLKNPDGTSLSSAGALFVGFRRVSATGAAEAQGVSMMDITDLGSDANNQAVFRDGRVLDCLLRKVCASQQQRAGLFHERHDY